MARGKAISVKIPTQRVIDALTQALAKLELDFTSQEQREAEYQIAYKAWQSELATWAVANFSKAENIRTNYRQWNNNLNVDFDITTKEGTFPAEPVKDFDTIHNTIKSRSTTIIIVILVHHIRNFESEMKSSISRILTNVEVGFVVHRFGCL